MSISEFGSEFKGARIQVLWPDTGEWYNAEVLKVNVGKRTATLWYSDSKEKEEIDLYEAILKMEVSWPKEGTAVGKDPAGKAKKRKAASVVVDDDDASDSDDVPLAAKAAKAASGNRSRSKPSKPKLDRADEPRNNARNNALAKFIEALNMAALEAGGGAGDVDVNALAAEVELALHLAATPETYNAKARTLIFNLKDPSNPHLRGRVLRGELTPQVLCVLSPTELARKDLQEMRREREALVGEDAFLKETPEELRTRTNRKGEVIETHGALVDGVFGTHDVHDEEKSGVGEEPIEAGAGGGEGEAPPAPRAAELPSFEDFAAAGRERRRRRRRRRTARGGRRCDRGRERFWRRRRRGGGGVRSHEVV